MTQEHRLGLRPRVAIVASLVLASQWGFVRGSDWALKAATERGDSSAALAYYAATSNAPDTLFVGDSRAGTDVDIPEISRLARSGTADQTQVAKVSLPGEYLSVVALIVERLVGLTHPPKTMLLSISEYQLSRTKPLADPTRDLWSVSEGAPAGYLRRALALDPYPLRLVMGWPDPLATRYGALSSAVRCKLGRWAIVNRCLTPGQATTADVSPEGARGTVLDQFRTLLHDYQIDPTQLAALRSLAKTAHTRGVALAYYVPAVAYEQFRVSLSSAAGSDHVPLFFPAAGDLTPSMWADPSHMNREGARAYARALASMMLSMRPSRGRLGGGP